jgi:hypothetical protein
LILITIAVKLFRSYFDLNHLMLGGIMTSVSDLLRGVVVESTTKSWTGPLFYSDKTIPEPDNNVTIRYTGQHPLNELARIPVIGIAAGVTRMALSVIHTIGHLFAALVTCNKGHLFHGAKGACEFLRGFIEAIPIAGRVFANSYYTEGYWWILKIYNPDAPDSLDRDQGGWLDFRQARPTAYVTA